MKLTEDIVERFADLYRGLDRAYGVWYPQTGQMETKKNGATLETYKAHLSGEVGLGMPMLMADGKCHFGAIDIDAHGEDEEIDIISLSKKVAEFDMPLVPCVSKSKGAHLYLFSDPPMRAKEMQSLLKKFAAKLGFGKSEIFPKQTSIGMGQIGNWINLPFFDAKETDRYCVVDGKILHLKEFLDYAEANRIAPADAKQMEAQDDSQAPPCLVHLMDAGVHEGGRNEAMFNFGIYYKKAFPEHWRDKLMGLNYSKFSPPLPMTEVEVIMKQVGGQRSYNYKCDTEPVASHCDRQACINRTYGIKNGAGIGSEVNIGEIKKMLVDPPVWFLVVNGIDVPLSTDELMNWDRVRSSIMEKCDIVAPPMKREDWMMILKDRMESKIDIEAPDDASIEGPILARLNEFTIRPVADATNVEELSARVAKAKSSLNNVGRGMPVVLFGKVMIHDNGVTKTELMTGVNTEGNGLPYVFFRGDAFIEYLKKKKTDGTRANDVWLILRKAGCGHTTMKIGNTKHTVWYRPVNFDVDGYDDGVIEETEF